jgi:hypothetical protein
MFPRADGPRVERAKTRERGQSVGAHGGELRARGRVEGQHRTGCRRQTLKCLIGDEARVDAAEGIGKSLQQGLQSAHDLGEVLQRATAAQLARVMDDDLDAKDAFAFAIDLQSQAATMQLEDRQIIGRSLDRDFPLCCALFSRTIFWTALASKDCLDSLQVQPRAATVKSQAS